MNKDVTPLLTHWRYVFLALTHRYRGVITSHSSRGCCVGYDQAVHGYGDAKRQLTVRSICNGMISGKDYVFVFVLYFSTYLFACICLSTTILKTIERLA